MTDLTEISVRPATNRDCAAIRELVFGILRDYNLELDLSGTDEDLSDIEAHYIRRGGVFEVLEDENGALLGSVGLYPIDAETIELRKMYFARELRGKGFGKMMLQRMIEQSRALGYKKIYLETASVLQEAVGLYEKFGFQPTDEKHTPRCDKAYVLEI